MLPESTRSVGPLDRRFKESGKAFAGFLGFVELGPGRTIVAIAEKLGKHPSMIRRWARMHRWAERAADHEADRRREERHPRADDAGRTRTLDYFIGEALDDDGILPDGIDLDAMSTDELRAMCSRVAAANLSARRRFVAAKIKNTVNELRMIASALDVIACERLAV